MMERRKNLNDKFGFVEIMEVSLNEIGEIITGNTPSKSDTNFWNSPDICFIKPDVIEEDEITELLDSNEYISESARNKARIVNENSILVTCIGSIAKIGIVKIRECAFNQQINAIIPNKNIDTKYLCYCLQNSKVKLKAIANAPVVPIINKKQFGEFVIKIVGDISTQKKIVNRLDYIQSVITLYKIQLQKFDDLIKARFIEMFGDLRTNNKNWQVVSFNECASIDTNMIRDFEGYEGYPHIGIDSIEKDTGRIFGYRTISEDGVIRGKYLFTPKHIIYSKIRPNLNKVALPDFIGLCSADAYPILVKDTVCTREYFGYTLRSRIFLDYILAFSSCTNLPKVNKSQVEGFKLPLPPIELQNQFADFVQQVDKSRKEVKKSLEKTQQLYDSLMQEYFG